MSESLSHPRPSAFICGSNPRILVTARAFAASEPESAAPLVAAGVEVAHAPEFGPLSEEALLAALPGIDVVIASSDAYSARVLDANPQLRGIVRWGVGVDSIDLKAATDRGVVVAYAPGTNTESVADFAFSLLLVVARRLCEGRTELAGGTWNPLRGVEVWRKTLGVIGFGPIGRAVCRRALGFSMRALAYDPFVPVAEVERLGAVSATLPDLLRESDFVSLHAALTPESRGMIGEAELQMMKQTAYLINAGRGALVDEAALLRALDKGWIAGAGIDCYATEPLPAGHPLARHPRCFATPHMAFNTVEVADRTNHLMAQFALDVLAGRRPEFVVNPEVYERE